MSVITQARNAFPDGNLHFKPVSARLSRGVLWAAYSIQDTSKNSCSPAFFSILAKVTLFTGSLLCVPIALIEAIAGFVLGGLGSLLNDVFCQGESQFLQKHSLKAFSFALHGGALAVALVVLGFKNPKIPARIFYAVADHIFHLGSAAIVQMTLGARWTGPESAQIRAINLLKDSHPDLIQDLFGQVQADMTHVNLIEIIDRLPRLATLRDHLRNYLTNHPEDREFITDFNLERIFADREYRLRSLGALRRFLVDEEVIQQGGSDPFHLELNQHNERERAYQHHLAELLRESLVKIHSTENLSKCLDTTDNKGTELLEMQDAGVYPPLTTYTQYQELLQEIQCPESFTGNLTQYNRRRRELIEAKQQVEELTNAQREMLEQKILRGANLEIQDEAVEAAFTTINEIATPLLQGSLMTQTAINLRALEGGGEITETRNLFQDAYQRALAQVQGNS